MGDHMIKCRKTGKSMGFKFGYGQCICPEGQCSEESYLNPSAAQVEDFFTPVDIPNITNTQRNSVSKLAPASRSQTKGLACILAPFTVDQVVALDAYQRETGPWARHPFTCPNRGDGKHGTNAVDLGALVPTTAPYGWICPYCDYTQNWAHTFMAGPLQPNPVQITPEMIKHMVDRFLWWKLPANFSPDAGITFKAEYNEHTAHPMKHEPTGTNLLDATQAYAMVQYMVVGGMPPAPVQSIDYPEQMLRDRDTIARLRKALREIINLPEVEGDQAPQIARAALDWEARDAAPRPGNCTLWPGCDCGTQSGPHTCEGKVP